MFPENEIQISLDVISRNNYAYFKFFLKILFV